MPKFSSENLQKEYPENGYRKEFTDNCTKYVRYQTVTSSALVTQLQTSEWVEIRVQFCPLDKIWRNYSDLHAVKCFPTEHTHISHFGKTHKLVVNERGQLQVNISKVRTILVTGSSSMWTSSHKQHGVYMLPRANLPL